MPDPDLPALAHAVPANQAQSEPLKHLDRTDLAPAAPVQSISPAPPPSPHAATEPPSAAALGELERIAELSLRLDRARAKPSATQLLLPPGHAGIAQAVLSQSGGALSIALVPGSNSLAADALDELRRRLAAKGVAVARLHLGDPLDPDTPIPDAIEQGDRAHGPNSRRSPV